MCCQSKFDNSNVQGLALVLTQELFQYGGIDLVWTYDELAAAYIAARLPVGMGSCCCYRITAHALTQITLAMLGLGWALNQHLVCAACIVQGLPDKPIYVVGTQTTKLAKHTCGVTFQVAIQTYDNSIAPYHRNALSAIMLVVADVCVPEQNRPITQVCVYLLPC